MEAIGDSTVTSEGAVTIPNEVRMHLGLEAGDRIEFLLADDGTVTLRPKDSAMERLRGVRDEIAAGGDTIDVETMRSESERAWEGVEERNRD